MRTIFLLLCFAVMAGNGCKNESNPISPRESLGIFYSTLDTGIAKGLISWTDTVVRYDTVVDPNGYLRQRRHEHLQVWIWFRAVIDTVNLICTRWETSNDNINFIFSDCRVGMRDEPPSYQRLASFFIAQDSLESKVYFRIRYYVSPNVPYNGCASSWDRVLGTVGVRLR